MSNSDENPTTKTTNPSPVLSWSKMAIWSEAILGDFKGGDGVRFVVQHRPSCYRRGPYMLQVEICGGSKHLLWGCFDDQDQPVRHYHRLESLLAEAQALANVLWRDRQKAERREVAHVSHSG